MYLPKGAFLDGNTAVTFALDSRFLVQGEGERMIEGETGSERVPGISTVVGMIRSQTTPWAATMRPRW